MLLRAFKSHRRATAAPVFDGVVDDAYFVQVEFHVHLMQHYDLRYDYDRLMRGSLGRASDETSH